MVVYPERHDMYPKPGLDGTFLDDVFLLCDQVASFQSKRASFEFRFSGRCCGLIRLWS